MNKTIKQAQSIVGTSPGRPKDDFYPTPEYVTRALLNVEDFPNPIIEPACGNGAISGVLENNGYRVYSYDLYDHGYGIFPVDYLDLYTDSGFYGCNPKYCSMITNPPFSLFSQFIIKSKQLKFEKFALFGKLIALEGQERSKILEDTNLTRIHVFRKRVQLTREGKTYKNSGMIAFAWFVWERDYIEKPIIDWI